MDFPREILKWLQYLNLGYSIKNVRTISNGVLISEIINLYLPQNINMNSLENGQSKEIKRKNWIIIKKALTNINIVCDENAIINSDKNETLNLLIKLYEYFNQKELARERYTIEEESESTIPSYARSTIAQKVRESDVHDIEDEKTKMLSTYELVEKEEQNKLMIKQKEKFDKENKNRTKRADCNDTALFNQIEHSSSILTVTDMRNYENYTEIQTLDSFIRDKDNYKGTGLASTIKGPSEIKRPLIRTKTQDESIEVIMFEILREYIPDDEVKISPTVEMNTYLNQTKGCLNFYDYVKFEEETTDNLYDRFFIICYLKKYELVKQILDRLEFFNEVFKRILLLRTYQFNYLWKLFFPVLTNNQFEEDVCIAISEYLKQFLSYLKINDVMTNDILCNIILRSIMLLENNESKELKYYCTLLVSLIDNNKHVCLNIMKMVHETMTCHFFYLFLSTLLECSPNSLIYNKYIKDIYLYYIYIGLHMYPMNIVPNTLDMIYMYSISQNYMDIVHLSRLLYNLLELKEAKINMTLFVISANLLHKLTEDNRIEEYSSDITNYVKTCSTIMDMHKDKLFIYIYFAFSYKIIKYNEDLYEKCLKEFNILSDEDQKYIISTYLNNNSLENTKDYDYISKHFPQVFNKDLNEYFEKSVIECLNLLLQKEKWKSSLLLRIIKNYMLCQNCKEISKCIEIYNSLYEHVISKLFEAHPDEFEISKEILNYYWFSPNTDLRNESYKISLHYLKKCYKENMNQLKDSTRHYLEDLQKDTYMKNLLFE